MKHTIQWADLWGIPIMLTLSLNEIRKSEGQDIFPNAKMLLSSNVIRKGRILETSKCIFVTLLIKQIHDVMALCLFWTCLAYYNFSYFVSNHDFSLTHGAQTAVYYLERSKWEGWPVPWAKSWRGLWTKPCWSVASHMGLRGEVFIPSEPYHLFMSS